MRPDLRSRAYGRALGELTRRHLVEHDEIARVQPHLGFAGARAHLRELYRDEFDRLYRDALVEVEDEDDVDRLRAQWVLA